MTGALQREGMTAPNETGRAVTGTQVALGLVGAGLAGVAGYHHFTYGSSLGLAGLVATIGLALLGVAGALPRFGVAPRDQPRVLGAAVAGGVGVAVLGVLAQSLAARPPTVENGGAGVAFLAGGGVLGGSLVGVNSARIAQLRRELSETEATAERLAEERGRFEVLSRATQSLLRAEDREQVAQLLVDEGRVGLPGPFAGVWLYESHRDRLVPAATSSTDPDWTAEQLWPDGGAMAVFHSGEPGVVEDEGLPDRNELYGVPLGDAGLLVVGTPGRFDERDRNSAKVYARTATVTLRRIERERELEQNNERLEAFASVLAQDLRNPLNVVETRIEMARQSGEVADLDGVLDATDRIETIIADVLELARGGERVGETEPVRLADVVEDAWANVSTYQATLEVAYLPTLEGDRDRLVRLFENCFRNAVEHGGHHVEVTVGPMEDRRGFFVADDGPGFPEEDRLRVLEEGYSTTDGTGIGLAIVRQIAEAHSWAVAVAESEAGGARLEFELGDDEAVDVDDRESEDPETVDEATDEDVEAATQAALDDGVEDTSDEATDEEIELALESDR
jgi:signal transduction histidine kinase